MRMRGAVIVGIPIAAVGLLGMGYAMWLSRVANEPLPDPSARPINCKRSAGGRGAILPESDAEVVYRWRCHLGRGAAVSSWVPHADEIDRLELALPSFWAVQTDRHQVRPLDSYVRQYAGFVANGRHGICISLVHISTLEVDADLYREDRELRA